MPLFVAVFVSLSCECHVGDRNEIVLFCSRHLCQVFFISCNFYFYFILFFLLKNWITGLFFAFNLCSSYHYLFSKSCYSSLID